MSRPCQPDSTVINLVTIRGRGPVSLPSARFATVGIAHKGHQVQNHHYLYSTSLPLTANTMRRPVEHVARSSLAQTVSIEVRPPEESSISVEALDSLPSAAWREIRLDGIHTRLGVLGGLVNPKSDLGFELLYVPSSGWDGTRMTSRSAPGGNTSTPTNASLGPNQQGVLLPPSSVTAVGCLRNNMYLQDTTLLVRRRSLPLPRGRGRDAARRLVPETKRNQGAMPSRLPTANR